MIENQLKQNFVMSDLSQPVDLYCERLDASFWAEPINAITNLSFILAGILAIALLRRRKQKSWTINTLAFLAIIVGIGSFTFHTVATKGAAFADTIPIGIFIAFALYVIFIRVFKAKPIVSILYVIAFAFANFIIIKLFGMKLLNGSIMYAPTLIILFFIALYSARKKQVYAHYILISATVFLISITFRSIDHELCAMLPIGTHFIWHILNGVCMYYQMKALIVAEEKPSEIIYN